MSNTIGLKEQEKYSIKNNSYVKTVRKDDRDYQVEIGDTKQNDFKPQLKASILDNDFNFSIRYDTKGKKGIPGVREANKITYDLGNETVEIYELKHGFEFGIRIGQNPGYNDFDFTIRTKGLKFYFQKDIDLMTPEERLRLPGDVHQPLKVKNSYAIYADKLPNDRAKMSQFKTGKVMHLYRPYAFDSNGRLEWCDLSLDLDNERLKVTVPKDFMDSASYPVFIDPDFGYTSVGGSDAAISASSKNTAHNNAAYHYTAGSDEQIDNFSLHCRVTIDSGLVEVGAYDMGVTNDPNGATLNSSADVSITNTSLAWVTSSDVDSAITNGNKYCVAQGDARPSGAATIRVSFDSVAAESTMAETSTTGALDASFNNDDGTLSFAYSMYATVGNQPGPPVFSGTIPDQTYKRTDSISFACASYFTNPETFTMQNNPAGFDVGSSSGEITDVATLVVGTYPNLTITCSNAQSPPNAVSNTFTITIDPQLPEWVSAITNKSGNVGSPITPIDLSLLVNFVDSGGYTLVGWPTGLSVDAAGLVTGTPDTEQEYVGCYVTGTNIDGPADSNTFTFSVGAALPVPTVTAVNGGNNLPRGQNIQITGTNLESSVTGAVTFNGVSLNITASTATTLNVDIPNEGFVFGTVSDLVITNDAGYDVTVQDQFIPESGFSYVTLAVSYSQLPSDSFLDGEAGLTNLAVGDQIMYETAANPSGTVSVDSNGVAVISGVVAAGDYDFDYLINDISDLTVSANGTAIVTLQGSGDDISAPNWVSSPAVPSGNITTTGATLTATIDETGDIFAVVVPQSEATPSIAQVIAGQDSLGNPADAAASALLGTSLSQAVTGLLANTAYKAVYISRDDEATPNVQTSVTIVNFSTLAVVDNTPPVFTTGPTVTQVTDQSATLNATIDEAGTIFWVIIPGGYADPDPAEIIGNNITAPDDTVTTAPFSGSGSPLTDLVVSGIGSGLPWKACFAARDDDNNVQITSTVINFTSSASGTTRSATDTIKDEDTGAVIASTLLDYYISASFGSAVTDSGQVTTDVSGVFNLTNLNVAAGSAWINFKDAATGTFVAQGSITVTEA